ncbi:MAG: hypothetical protein J5I65_13995 [Aridibacter famidurans]|nr:hypothetical protein [Aridibacter famidurans]
MFRSRSGAFIVVVVLAIASAVQAAAGGFGSDKIDFPEVEGWTKSEVTVFSQPELGYAVSYESQTGGRVTVYAYNGGLVKIGNGADSKEVEDEIKKALGEINAYVVAGYYERAETIRLDKIKLGGDVEALRYVLALTIRGQIMTSEIYLFGHENQFIKFRATRAMEEDGEINESVRRLFKEIAKTLSEGRSRPEVGAREGSK